MRFTRIQGTHPGAGFPARRATTFLMLGDKTDIKAGTVTRQDAGIEGKSSRPLRAALHGQRRQVGRARRGLERRRSHARSGVQRAEEASGSCSTGRMTEIIREQPFSGRVLGVGASYSPRFDLSTKARLESYWQNGNVDERRETIHIRARRAVFVGSGGHGANPQFRSMFYPAFNEPAFVSSAWACSGPTARTRAASSPACGSAPLLRGCSRISGRPRASTSPRLATRDSYTDMLPGHPTFPVPKIHRHHARHELVRAPDRREPGGQALL